MKFRHVGKALILGLVIAAASLMIGKVASAQVNQENVTEGNIEGSTILGFDASLNLLPAAINTDPTLGPCFSCPNTALGNTAGALTNSMFGEIRENADADLGDQSFGVGNQDMDLPGAAACGSNCNDSGPFIFSLPMDNQDFLNDGTPVTGTAGTTAISGGKAGVEITKTMTFEFLFNVDPATDAAPAGESRMSRFDQTIGQTTFVGGFGGTDFQVVSFSVDSEFVENPTEGNTGGVINFEQTIEEGGFVLSPAAGSFVYNGPGNTFDDASHPSGPSQSIGDTSATIP